MPSSWTTVRATGRPSAYWVWANLAALAVSAGPLVGSAIAVGLVRLRGFGRSIPADRALVLLTVAATATVLIADVSGTGKAEVERIWLPFVPWLLVGTALLSERWQRWGLTGQLGFALVAQHVLATGW